MSRMQRRLPSNVWRRWILTNSYCSFSVLSLDLHTLLNFWIGSWNSTDASWAKWKEDGVWADTEWSRDSLIGSSQETLFAASISWVKHCALIHLSKILKLTFVCIINVLCVCGTWTIHVHQHTWKISTWSARKLYDMLDWCYIRTRGFLCNTMDSIRKVWDFANGVECCLECPKLNTAIV